MVTLADSSQSREEGREEIIIGAYKNGNSAEQ